MRDAIHHVVSRSDHVLGAPRPFMTLRTLSTDDIGIIVHI